jgi:glycine/D-amino acid oxidase-like deaminating enzyme
MEYDYIIVGAGISGLLSGIKIAKRYPKARIAITEMYPNAGGRIQTFHKGQLHWEKGAGRIHSSHHLASNLINNYGLTKVILPENTEWRSEGFEPSKNMWPSLAMIILHSFSNFSKADLQLYTLHQLMEKILDGDMIRKMISRFAYTSEITALRADLALHALEKELGGTQGHFYTIQEGLQTLTDNMKEDALQLGVKFFFDYRLTSIDHGIYTKLNFATSFKEKKQLRAKKIILAIHSEALRGLSAFKNLPILKKITMKPLLRIYGVFPTPAWFQNIPRTITDSLLRHIIPISAKSGTIMTSYTDAEDTKFWINLLNAHGEKEVSRRIVKESEKLFQKKIPNPHLFKIYHWEHGCSYWLPGLYDVNEYSQKIMQPLPLKNPNIFVCGESYAIHQAWIESALTHTTEMLERYIL